jgi:hypothetical protein
MLRTTAIALLVTLAVAASGCGGGSGSPLAPPPPPPPSASVAISPDNDTLGVTSRRQFTAAVTGANSGVSWKVKEGSAGGTVTSDGLYTAPSSTGTFHVTATSVASTRSATATVAVVPSGFVPTSNMRAVRTGHSATLLADGRVLIVGGGDGSGVLASAELFDPGTGSFSSTKGNMNQAREGHRAVLLPSGKVLIAGGDDSTESLSSVELFDPANESFTTTRNMTTARSGATATLLPNGKVLVAGGVDKSDALLATAELYDPTTGSFTATAGNMTSARWSHTATLLANGKVLLTGGRVNFAPNTNSATAELFDPSTATFTATGSMTILRDFHSATLLGNGQVLVLGGDSAGTLASVSNAELYNPATSSFTSAAGSLIVERSSHTASLLPNGKVLVAGGVQRFLDDDGIPNQVVLWTAELFDPSTGSSTLTGSLETQRLLPTATLLMDGRVLVTGGYDGTQNLTTAELYK